MYVNDTKGNALSATASVETIEGIIGVVLASRGGAAGSPNERNIDYFTALEAILSRLSKLSDKAVIYVVSTKAMKIWNNMDDRSIGEIKFSERNIKSIKSTITTRVKDKKENPNSTGGNSTKRILISANLSNEQLQHLITGK